MASISDSAQMITPTMTVDFIGIGTQKAGTTTFFHILDEHPQICMAVPKEVEFFTLLLEGCGECKPSSREEAPVKVDFIGIGSPKAGTSTIAQLLAKYRKN